MGCFEAIIAGPDVVIDGITIAADAVTASLPVPLLLNHGGNPIGCVYALQPTSRGLVASCETDVDTTNFSHVSPSLRVHSAQRMTLLELSLVRQSVSPATIILSRSASDAWLDYQRSLAAHSDLVLKHLTTLQRLIPLLQEPNR